MPHTRRGQEESAVMLTPRQCHYMPERYVIRRAAGTQVLPPDAAADDKISTLQRYAPMIRHDDFESASPSFTGRQYR